MEKNNLPVYAGVAVASFLAGSLCSYLRSKQFPVKEEEEKKRTSNKSFYSSTSLDRYIVSTTLLEPEILVELKEYTLKNVHMAVMLSDSVQVQFFRMILKTLKAERCIEVGSFTGYNVLSSAITLPANGVIYALDISDEYLSHGRPFFKKAGVDHKINEMIGPAKTSMEQLLNKGLAGSFDFIYVDADKDGYADYYELGIQLIRVGGIIALDNMLQKGMVYDASKIVRKDQQADVDGIKKVTQIAMCDGRVDVSFLKIGDGVMLCRKK